MTILLAIAVFWRRRARFRVGVALVAAATVACGGCQTLFPAALPGGLAFTEDARIAKRAKSDAFPSPADVGLSMPTSVP